MGGGVTQIRFWVGWINAFWVIPLIGLFSAVKNSNQEWRTYYFDIAAGIKLDHSEAFQMIAQNFAKKLQKNERTIEIKSSNTSSIVKSKIKTKDTIVYRVSSTLQINNRHTKSRV